MMDMLDIIDAPESKLKLNTMREMIEPNAEIWRRVFLPKRCGEIKSKPQVKLR